jgi:hypothetical protein
MAAANNRSSRNRGLSEKTKRSLLIGSGSVLCLMLGWWAYYTFTTMSPPDLKKATPQQVAGFFSSTRGLARMGIDDRERYMVEAYNKFSQGESRQQMCRAFGQMSAAEKEVFVNVAFDTFKTRFLQKATEYNRLPKHERAAFVENMIANFETQRQSVAGYGGADNVAEPFKGAVPATSDGMAKTLVDRTTASQRNKAQPLFDAVAARMKEKEESRKRGK